MVAVGVAALWAGYSLTVWGYCLVKGYNVTFMDLFRNTWPGVKVATQAASGGHQLGTITGHASTTSPGQL